jgi:O-antigen/teichoic acid export membrane protein
VPANDHDIHNDIRLSALFGPLKFVIPVIGYVLLYPVIINRYGYDVLGLWSLLSAIPYTLSTLDVGFSQHIAREANRSADAAMMARIHHHYTLARKFYFAASLLICLLVLIVFWIQTFPDLPYQEDAFSVAVILMILAVLVELLAKLEASILQAGNDTYFTQIVNGIIPAILFACAFTGAWLGYPLELLSFGYLLSYFCALTIFRLRITARHKTWIDAGKTADKTFSLSELKALLKSGIYLYGTSIGMLVRDPVLRFTIASVAGLESAAVYEIAMRVGRTAREFVATGFLSLYPSFSFLLRKGQTKAIELITQRTLALLLITGWSGLCTIAVLSPWIYEIWLGASSDELVSATQVICIWCGLTLFNVPFWHLILAGHKEKLAALAIWIHTLSTFLIYPVSKFISLSLVDILVLWTIVAAFTQIIIYAIVEKHFKIFFNVIREQNVIKAVLFTLIFIAFEIYAYRMHELQAYTVFIMLGIFYLVSAVFFRETYKYWIFRGKEKIPG